MEYENRDRGVLFKHTNKELDSQPDYKGSINVGGVEYWLSAWIRTSKKDGTKYMSLSVKPKEKPKAAPAKKPAPTTDHLNDEIGF